MNQLSNMRIKMYKTLSEARHSFQNALAASQSSLTGQRAAVSIIEDDLNQSKRRLAMLEEENNTKLRLVQINDYYGDKYVEHGNLMKIIIFTLAPIIVLVILKNIGILPEKIYLALLIVVAAIGGYFFWKRYGSIITRDTMDYQTYNWYFDIDSAPVNSSDSSSSSSNNPWLSTKADMTTCVGNLCCSDGQTYDELSNKCIAVTEPVTEGMINNVLIKGSNKYKADVVMNGDERVKPSAGKSFIHW